MSYFLLVYDRPAGRLRSIREYPESEGSIAYAELDRLEAAKEAHIEVVILGSRSRADIEKTHSRYFLSLEQMLTGLFSPA